MDRENDMKKTHYQPTKGTTVCGAAGRVVKRVESGLEEKFAILKLHTTTRLASVDCPYCRAKVAELVLRTWSFMACARCNQPRIVGDMPIRFMMSGKDKLGRICPECYNALAEKAVADRVVADHDHHAQQSSDDPTTTEILKEVSDSIREV
jgi:hypothetical protein